jgi:threonine/homoserine/homoserine lactone efflux protein
MDVSLFLSGLLVGFAIAAPVGPIGLLCIQRTLTYGRLVGLATGLGAASADALYGLIAGLGLTVIASFLEGQRLWLGLIGGLFLCYLGVRTFLSVPAEQAANLQMQGGRWGAYFSTLLLTLTNPMTIFSFLTVFAGLGLVTTDAANGSGWRAATLVTGVFLGSALWWLLLSGLTSLLRRWINSQTLVWVNRVAGAILVGFGGYLLLDLILWV